MKEYINSIYQSPYSNKKKLLLDNGYERYILAEHCLYDDELWVHPNTIKAWMNNERNTKYVFCFYDKPLNEWSSTQTMKRFSKLAQKHLKILDLI